MSRQRRKYGSRFCHFLSTNATRRQDENIEEIKKLLREVAQEQIVEHLRKTGMFSPPLPYVLLTLLLS